METYNGWSNWITWYVQLHIISDIQFEYDVTTDYIEELVTDIIYDNNEVTSYIARDILKHALNEINYIEITENINRNLP